MASRRFYYRLRWVHNAVPREDNPTLQLTLGDVSSQPMNLPAAESDFLLKFLQLDPSSFMFNFGMLWVVNFGLLIASYTAISVRLRFTSAT
jgi:hypothetical protein